jgi:RimJ/RimL family protein N-acetyltransferase
MAERGVIAISFQTERFLFRPLTAADVSSRWAGWLNDPVAMLMLNARPRTFSQDELRDYIASFDGRNRWLVGFFDRQSGEHIGIGTGELVEGGNKFISSILIGEPQYRNLGILTEILDSMGDHYFETLGFEATVASVVAHNAIVIGFLQSRGFKLVRTLPGFKKSARGGPDIDILIYEFSRDDWRVYRDTKRAAHKQP